MMYIVVCMCGCLSDKDKEVCVKEIEEKNNKDFQNCTLACRYASIHLNVTLYLPSFDIFLLGCVPVDSRVLGFCTGKM